MRDTRDGVAAEEAYPPAGSGGGDAALMEHITEAHAVARGDGFEPGIQGLPRHGFNPQWQGPGK
nr:hypothetical protein [Mycolicibacterium septicum]